MKKLKAIHYVLLCSLLARVILYFVQSHPVWWDTGVYASMGRYIFSFGKVGLWEAIRPPVMPILMGLASGFGSEVMLFWAFLLHLLFTIGVIYLTYLIARELFNERVGIVASIMLGFTPYFFFFSYIPLSDIPSAFFAMLAIYFFIKGKDVAAGVFAAIAVMTRFPQGVVLISMVLVCFSIRRALKIGMSFILALLPYFALNFILYSNPLFPLAEGDAVIKTAGLWLFQGGWHFYLVGILRDNWLFVFAIAGLVALRKKKSLAVFIPLLALLVYFSVLPHKEMRFALVCLPYLAIFAAYGIYNMAKARQALYYLLVIIVMGIFVFNLRLESYGGWQDDVAFYGLLSDEDIPSRVLTSTPLVGLYTNAKLELMYYPVFDSNRASWWRDYIKYRDDISYVFFDTCSGLLCAPGDSACVNARQELEEVIKKDYSEVFYRGGNGCYCKTFKNNML